MITFKKVNEVYCRIDADRSEISDLSDRMTFEVPGAKFSPLVQQGMWDGKIRLINQRDRLMYSGLIPHALLIATELQYEAEVDEEYNEHPFSVAEAERFVKSLKLPFAPHDFQMQAFITAVQTRRRLFLSPTSSGKSLIIYLILMYFKQKSIIVVPTTALVNQMVKDFKSYGYQGDMLKIMAGTEKVDNNLFSVSTWHSIYQLPVKYFSQFNIIIGDEVHRFTSKSLVDMMKKTVDVPTKIGLTGSLDGSKTHELVLRGLFGEVGETITTREMIDRGISSDINIKVFMFSYTKEQLNLLPPKSTFLDQTNFIISNEHRNRFIKNLVDSLTGNVVVLFRRVEDHGDILFDLLKKGRKKIYYIHGGTDTDDRTEIQRLMEEHDDICVVASDGTFATGISVNNIQHVIRGNPIKSEINNVQGMGRGLRKDGKTNVVNYYDLADDLGIKPTSKNYIYNHALERMKLYVKKELPFKTYKITLGEL